MTKVRKTCTLAFKLELIKLIEEQGKKISDVCSGQLMNRPGIVGDLKLWDNTLIKSKQYQTEVKSRAIELLIESQKDYPSLWAAIQAIAPKFGCTPETLRSWHQKHLAKQNPVTVSTESQAARIAELEREIRELKQANEIIRKAAAFFAQAELDRKPKWWSNSLMMKRKIWGPFDLQDTANCPIHLLSHQRWTREPRKAKST